MTTTQTFTEETTSVAGLAIRVLVGGEGPRLIWLHHSTGSLGWLPLHEKLSEKFRVVVPDLPGFGQSERPTWARHPRDIAMLMQRMAANHTSDPYLLVGHGFGGWIAAEMATMNPEALSGLVLVGAAGIQPNEGEIMDQIMWDYEDYVKQGFSDDAAFTTAFGEEIDKELRELWDFSREMTARLTWKPWMFNRQLPPLLPEVATPSLLVWGEHDRVIPLDCAKQFEAALPNATLEIVSGAGHLLEMEQPETLAALITGFADNA